MATGYQIKSTSLLTLACASLGSILDCFSILSCFLYPIAPGQCWGAPPYPDCHCFLPTQWRGCPMTLPIYVSPPLCSGILHSGPLVAFTCLHAYLPYVPFIFPPQCHLSYVSTPSKPRPDATFLKISFGPSGHYAKIHHRMHVLNLM